MMRILPTPRARPISSATAAVFEALGRVFTPADDDKQVPAGTRCRREPAESPAQG
jgi:hypothetical protein